MTSDYAADTLHVIVFRLGTQEFAVEIQSVHEVDRMRPITRVPRAPRYVEGVINLRGQLVPIIDLRARLGMERSQPTKLTRILIAEVTGRRIGMIVDAVTEVSRIPIEHLGALTENLAGFGGEYISAVAKLDDRLIMQLELAKVLAADENGLEGLAAAAAKESM